MKKVLLMLATALFVVSCQDELSPVSDSGFGKSVESENEYAISIDDALENLSAFLSEADDPATRSAIRVVSSIKPVKYSILATKGNMDSLDCDNLLYVANFEQEQGYAILAADKRIEEKVIAVADEGHLSDATVYSAMELTNAERIIVDGYPTTGPGFFTTAETGDELFMNPNTVVLYDENENDTLVGNFSLDDLETEEDDIVNANPLTSMQQNIKLNSTSELVTSALCTSYACNQIRDYNRLEDEIIKDDFVRGDDKTEPEVTNKTETSGWSVKKSVSPILTKFVKWGQDSPFNDLYPYRRKYLIVGSKRQAPAGCFPLAIAKILTHFEYPDVFTYNGYTVNWNELKKSYNSEKGKKSAANLLMGISSGCKSCYFYQGTFTFPGKATSYMRSIGLNNSHSHDYSFDRVTGMIDNGCPIVIYSVPGINVFVSHSWNIDGYKIKERTITTKTYSGSTLINTSTRTETCKMVHCDFGWGGQCNGYYVSGVFKLNDSRVEHDPGTVYGRNTYYNNLLKVVTYEKP